MDNPETINALIKAHAPGIGIISILWSIACLTKISPGSDMAGVPASVTKAIDSPIFYFFYNLYSIIFITMPIKSNYGF